MTQKGHVKTTLLTGLILISFGGWLLHMRIHPVYVDATHFIPFIVGLVSLVAVPLLFMFSRTVHYGYVLNGMIVIIGTVTMFHYTLENLPEDLSLYTFFLKTTVPDIMILWCKFVVGKALFDLEVFGFEAKPRKGTWYRYPFMGWWWIHLGAMSLVYYAGMLLWR